jgi:dTDP-4-amino-4,6-dideoxygalactose transaminase
MSDKLAFFGGDPITREPFPSWPRLCEKAVSDAMEPLRSGRLTYWAGAKGREFEKRWAEWIGARNAVSCSSGTAALHVALASLGIGPGDEVIVPSHSFIASAFSAFQSGASPVFCDVTDDHTVDPRSLESRITDRTKAAVIVHLYGVVADMGPILRVAERRGLRLIEDCAQCVGGEYKGRKAGTIGDVGCFSFSQSKHFTTGGEGGMLVTSDDALARELRSVRDHGYEAEAWLSLPAGAEQPRSAHRRIGYNYRLTEMQSAIGLAELGRLDTWNLQRRMGYARAYDHAFSRLYGIGAVPRNDESRKNAYWEYPLLLDLEKLTVRADRFQEALAAEGIPSTSIKWREAYEEPAFAGMECARCGNAETLRERTVVLFLHPTWERPHIELCIAGVKKVLRAFKR